MDVKRYCKLENMWFSWIEKNLYKMNIIIRLIVMFDLDLFCLDDKLLKFGDLVFIFFIRYF